jgi:membrane protease YdiL (CAAX protease family)
MKESMNAPFHEEGSQFDEAIYQQHLPQGTPSDSNDQPTWSFRDTMVGVLLTLVPWLVIAWSSALASSSQQAPTKPLTRTSDVINAILTFILQSVLEGVFLIAPLWFAVFKPRRVARARGLPEPGIRSGLAALGFRAFNLWKALAGLALGVCAIFFASYLYEAITQALHIPAQTNVDVIQTSANAHPWTTLAILLSAVTVAPFCEETFFRGFFFQGLRLRINVWVAVVLSAIVFGFAHGDLGSLALLIVIGLLLAILRWKTRSIWPGMVLHALNNLLAAIIILQALQFH